jgi:hypothetical protein
MPLLFALYYGVAGGLVVKKVVWCIRSLLAAAILTFAVPSANADDRTVQWLYESCQMKDSDRYGICVGYIAGIGDLMFAFGANARQSQDINVSAFSICGNASYAARVQAFVNWAKANPQKWSDPYLFGVAEALRLNWPCR